MFPEGRVVRGSIGVSRRPEVFAAATSKDFVKSEQIVSTNSPLEGSSDRDRPRRPREA